MNSKAIHLSDDAAGYDDIGLEAGVLPDHKELPAWAVSLVVHVAVLAFFWMIHLSGTVQPDLQINSQVQPVEKDLVVEVAVNQTEIGNRTNADRQAPSKASALLPGQDLTKEFDRQLVRDNLEVTLPEPEPIQQPARDAFVSTVQTNGETIDTGGTAGAIDILTREIEASVRERKTLVVWLFDASQSLSVRREEIADRFQNVYRELRERNEGIDEMLETAVVSYGKKTAILTDKPVRDVKDVVAAVRNIKPDTFGEEFVFTAVADTMKKFRKELMAYRRSGKLRQNVMFVVVTDERGDDFAGPNGNNPLALDQLIGELRKYQVRVYCVGNASIFGREKGYVSFTDDTGYRWDRIEVDQGPETVAPERLTLPFFGGATRRLENLSASSGPWALTRMCTETRGLFLIAEHSAGAVKFPADVMRGYRPFYGTIPNYMKGVRANRAKLALHLAATKSMSEPIPAPQRRFQANTETVLRQQISTAQRPLAVVNFKLDEMLAVLNEGEKDRPKIAEDRWRAGYDLAMGRALATKVRAIGYQEVVAEMSRNPMSFKSAGNNMWELVPSKNWENYPPQVKRLAEKAVMYLKRVMDEHPDTPWAMLAEHELSTELGWEWREGRMNIPTPGAAGNNNNNPTPKKKRPRTKPKL